MVPRYALRKLTFFPHPVRTHAPHPQRATNGTMRGGARQRRRCGRDTAPRHQEQAAAPLSIRSGFADPTVWNIFATSIVSGARRDPKAKKQPRRIGRVRPRLSRQSLPGLGNRPGCWPSQPAQRGLTCWPLGEASPVGPFVIHFRN
jgi:hypothetical protein